MAGERERAREREKSPSQGWDDVFPKPVDVSPTSYLAFLFLLLRHGSTTLPGSRDLPDLAERATICSPRRLFATLVLRIPRRRLSLRPPSASARFAIRSLAPTYLKSFSHRFHFDVRDPQAAPCPADSPPLGNLPPPPPPLPNPPLPRPPVPPRLSAGYNLARHPSIYSCPSTVTSNARCTLHKSLARRRGRRREGGGRKSLGGEPVVKSIFP